MQNTCRVSVQRKEMESGRERKELCNAFFFRFNRERSSHERSTTERHCAASCDRRIYKIEALAMIGGRVPL